jgi:hypothetical protein
MRGTIEQKPTDNGKPANGQAPPGPPLTPSADGTGKDPATGRFLPGNKCGRGNPHYRKLAENRTAFLQIIGPEKVKDIARILWDRAMWHKDNEAAKLLLAYAIGRPQPAADPDRADLNELALFLEGPDIKTLYTMSCERISASLAADLVATSIPTTPDDFAKWLQKGKEAIDRKLADMREAEEWGISLDELDEMREADEQE